MSDRPYVPVVPGPDVPYVPAPIPDDPARDARRAARRAADRINATHALDRFIAELYDEVVSVHNYRVPRCNCEE